MNKFRRVIVLILLTEIFLFAIAGLYLAKGKVPGSSQKRSEAYRVEIERAIKEMEKRSSLSTGDLDGIAVEYPSILEIRPFDKGEIVNEEYRLGEVNGTLYRFSYQVDDTRAGLMVLYVSFVLMVLLTLGVMFYIQRKILAPFTRMTDVTEDLAKGNLAMPLVQEKSGYFKSFLWSIDMLREKLTDDRTREMALQKEKKTIVLSLAHDIKTPLAAIDLYSKALSGNLYETEERRNAALKGIEKNAEEIKRYVNEIVTASREDFLDLSVKVGEVYLSDVIRPVEKYYRDKLNLLAIDFSIEEYQDVLLSCDASRLVEAMQNCMENAIKYGDGKKILIGIEEEENCKLITIENTGCTLKAEEEDAIFDSFYRGSNTQGIQGSGLGLYICRELLRAMDGEVYAKIERGNFRITLVVRML
uniref:sensor histidine kinase n=1 Tax=Eubacterium cellulosolvens TaxID=29322 RepID=UPI00048536DB|nr:HAMP domain-containing sensor histidine kinase [[Eubacterium] cellulosolvens]